MLPWMSVRPEEEGSEYHATRPGRSVARGFGTLLGVPGNSWKIMSCPGSLPGPGGCCTVKAGKLNVVGRLPVVKYRGKEPVPSLNTCRISYVVPGSMPATKTFVLL